MADEAKLKGKVLIVEDESFLRELYQELLADDGYDVTVASDGLEAMELSNESKYDLTLLDIMLPKKDGLQVLEESAAVNKIENLGKVVLLTNLGQEAVIKRGFDLGAVGYLIKSSYTPNQVLEEVASFISGENKPLSD